MLPVVVDSTVHEWLMSNPGAELNIDVRNSTLELPDGRTTNYPIDTFARYCLFEGIDQLGFIRKNEDAIRTFEENRAWTP